MMEFIGNFARNAADVVQERPLSTAGLVISLALGVAYVGTHNEDALYLSLVSTVATAVAYLSKK